MSYRSSTAERFWSPRVASAAVIGVLTAVVVFDTVTWRPFFHACSNFLLLISQSRGAVLGHLLLLIILTATAVSSIRCIWIVIANERQWRQTRLKYEAPSSDLRYRLLRLTKPFAATVGILHPQTYISTGLFARISSEELDAVLQHEAFHRTHRDPLRIVLWQSLRAVFFFLPLLRTCSAQALTSIEIAADRNALQHGVSKTRLLTAMRAFHVASFSDPHASAGFAVHGSAVERLAALRNEPGQRTSAWLAFASTLAVCALFALPAYAMQAKLVPVSAFTTRCIAPNQSHPVPQQSLPHSTLTTNRSPRE